MYSRCLLLSLPAAPLTFPPHNKRAPLNALYGVKVGVLESCHLIGSEDFAIPQSPPELSRYFLCRIIMLSYLTYIERIHKMLLSLVPTQAVLPVCWDLCEVLGMAEGTF